LSYHCLLSVRLKSSVGEVVDGFMGREKIEQRPQSGSMFPPRCDYRFVLKTLEEDDTVGDSSPCCHGTLQAKQQFSSFSIFLSDVY
jgi:hypothetical protein